MNEMAETEATESNGLDNLMSPEELALFKKLQAKNKAMKKAMGGHKENLFNLLTENYLGQITQAQKNVVTVSTKEAQPDGFLYAISYGVETEESESDLDTNALAVKIITDNLATIEPIMGISNSMKVSGEIDTGNVDSEGKPIKEKVFWQIRKRESA
jgi:hypothetical protein